MQQSKHKSASHIATWVFTLVVIIALYLGWQIRHEYYINAELGVGYYLGIVGGSMMLLLLIYPIKKHFPRSPWFIFSTTQWFKIHMAMGILGPLAILYHSNFSLGSTNSNVALASMFLMVLSGLIGRYIYSRIHHGLFGKRIELGELIGALNKMRNELTVLQDAHHKSNQEMAEFASALIDHYAQIAYVESLDGVNKASYREVSKRAASDSRQLKKLAKQGTWPAHYFSSFQVYIKTVRKIVSLRFYERLFSLWHMLHLPIFFMLVITGFVHVYAVHVY